MRRRFAICLSALTVLTMATLGALWFATRPTHRINETTVEQIKEGMTLAEVESIFGVPAGDYSTQRVISLHFGGGGLRFYKRPPREWITNDISIVVHFDDNDRVENARSAPVFAIDESWWTRFRRWARLE